MNYLYPLLICLSMMISISILMYYLGKKISYNYILYNASVSVGAGVIFFLFKMIFSIGQANPIGQLIDTFITLILIIVWLIILVETLTIEVMENGRDIKANMMTLINKMKEIELKSFPSKAAEQTKLTFAKTKSIMIRNKLIMKIQKLIAELH